ncbi:hypothetical protein GJ496_003822 [Pomphorhynchus laevis]|nr:hypothetical protein GJ496_003822 [Pomphorhynchus laevis]
MFEFVSSEIAQQLFAEYIKIVCSFGLCSKLTAIRHMSARCVSAALFYVPEHFADTLTDLIIPSPKTCSERDETTCYQGAVELVKYSQWLCVPVLQMTSNQDYYIRIMANKCFATLLKLYPLQDERRSGQQRIGEHILDTLLRPSSLNRSQMTFKFKIDLRPYQKDGIRWLTFLQNYNLNGILCDDMGLGKTLQTLYVLMTDIQNRNNLGVSTDPSLVICPSTVVQHWTAEIEKFFGSSGVQYLAYYGSSSQRESTRNTFLDQPQCFHVLVASYDSVRNDIHFFSSLRFSYVVLDEGHIIRRSKTKISNAIRQLSAKHRLILTGTPIQNNLTELWNLFNFLMPGYLGTERQFNIRFGKPLNISSNKDSNRCTDIEKGAVALGALHKQVLPLMLRRTKRDVLTCLPPKIIQDYYCEMSVIQSILYDEFCNDYSEGISNTNTDKSGQESNHVFKTLLYLKKLCNHPAIVCNETHPKWNEVQEHLTLMNVELSDIRNSGKLNALRELLLECGVGESSVDITQKHRILVFCQYQATLDFVELCLLDKLTNIKYLRLDGSVPTSKRYDIIKRFNENLYIDLLLLTTQVGGLGISLTGADVVIFVEHDWNPARDLQAMDRAHRLGQTKTVNVYRLITKGTIEEKIMK